MSSTKSKAKNTNTNSEEGQASVYELIERLNLNFEEKFVMFEKRFTALEEDFAKFNVLNSEKKIVVIDEKTETPTRVADGLDYSELPFKHNDNFGDVNPMRELKKERSDPVVSMLDFDAPKNQVFATTPDHKHIYLKSLEVRPALKFLKEVKQFMQQHGVPIRIAYQIAERNCHLIARANNMSLDQFRASANSICEKMLRLQVQPKSAVEFLDLMKTIKFYISDDIRLSQASFETIYTSFLVYASSYREMYEFLNNGQNEDLIPPIDIRKKGLVYVFLNNLPKTFADVFINIMNRDGFFHSKPLPTFAQFLDKYELIVKEKGYHVYISYKTIEIICKHFGEDMDVLKANTKSRDSQLLVMNANSAPGILKKDLKQPCYRYFMEKLYPDFKAGKCKFDHSADAMKILFSKIKNHWSNLVLTNRLHSLEDIPIEAPNDDVEESESFDYSCLHHSS